MNCSSCGGKSGKHNGCCSAPTKAGWFLDWEAVAIMLLLPIILLTIPIWEPITKRRNERELDQIWAKTKEFLASEAARKVTDKFSAGR